MALKTTRTTDSASATADLLEAIKSLDNIECGEEARKHFNFAPSYRNLNHGKSSQWHCGRQWSNHMDGTPQKRTLGLIDIYCSWSLS
jgi:hypothetical protein